MQNWNYLTKELMMMYLTSLKMTTTTTTMVMVMTMTRYTTLHKYWMKQDNATINNNLGLPLIDSEARIFQQHLSTPIINLKFSNDEKEIALSTFQTQTTTHATG